MEILKAETVTEIIKRMALEIIENNFDEKEIYIAGLNNNGYLFAKILSKELDKYDQPKPILFRLKIDPSKPTQSEVEVSLDASTLKNKVVLVVDDVLNTGRTLFYAIRPLMDVLCKKVEVAVLVNRKHHNFPISSDYIGLSLATTIQENIKVKLDKVKERSVVLE